MQSVSSTTNPTHGEVYSIQINVIKFASDLRGLVICSTNKTGHQDITEILLKVALNTINQPTNQPIIFKRGLRIMEGQVIQGNILIGIRLGLWCLTPLSTIRPQRLL